MNAAVTTVFALLGVLAVGSAVLVVTARQIVHAALWLVVALGSVAGCYLLLRAEFVAWVQVLVYVGAVVVLLLFALMLTKAPIGVSDDLDASVPQRVVAAVVALATGVLLVTVLVAGFHGAVIDASAATGSASAIGGSVFRSWVLPFEVLSVLLLAALIGAIVLSRRDVPGAGATDPEPGGH